MKFLLLLVACCLNNLLVFAAPQQKNADDRYFYLGGEYGISDPTVKTFREDIGNSKVKITLQKTQVFGIRGGYSFYPNILIELAATHHSAFKFNYTLPETNLAPIITDTLVNSGFMNQKLAQNYVSTLTTSVPKTKSGTRVSSNVFMLNIIYEFEKSKIGMKPYVIFGAGVARVGFKEQITYWQPDQNVAQLMKIDASVPLFKIKNNTHNCLSYQIGVGISQDISDNFAINLNARLQVVKDIKIRYQSFDPAQNTLVNKKPIKKTIGVNQYTIGFIFKIPVK